MQGTWSNVDGNIHLENFACTSGVKERTVRLIQTSPGCFLVTINVSGFWASCFCRMQIYIYTQAQAPEPGFEDDLGRRVIAREVWEMQVWQALREPSAPESPWERPWLLT